MRWKKEKKSAPSGEDIGGPVQSRNSESWRGDIPRLPYYFNNFSSLLNLGAVDAEAAYVGYAATAELMRRSVAAKVPLAMMAKLQSEVEKEIARAWAELQHQRQRESAQDPPLAVTRSLLFPFAFAGPINLMRISLRHGAQDLKTFEHLFFERERRPDEPSLGRLLTERIDSEERFEEVLEACHLVWYDNGEPPGSWWGADNHTLGAYPEQRARNDERITRLLESLGKGLTKPLTITVASDETLGRALIIDGTHRAIALKYLRGADPELFHSILGSQLGVHVQTLTSPVAHVLFPCDFFSLVKEHYGGHYV